MPVVLDLLLGYATAIIPTMVIMSHYPKNSDQFDYASVLASTPVFFALTNLLVLSSLDVIYNNYDLDMNTRFAVAGFVIAMVYSNIGRFYLDIPGKILEMKDPIWFNLYAIITWIIVYFVVYAIRDSYS